MSKETLLATLLTRTVSPSLHPRLASGDAADFLLASALSYSPTGLATSRRRRRAMRPTDVCHPNDTACTRTSRVPGSLSPLSRRGVPTESWAPRGTSGDLDVSRRPWSLRRIGQHSRNSSSAASRPGDTSVGVFFPRRCCDRASDTPVAILRFTLRFMRLRACCVLSVRSSLWKLRTGWRVRKTAKTTVVAVS